MKYGYVHRPLDPVYAGFVPSPTPDADQITAMSRRGVTRARGAFTLAQSGAMAQYPCLAFPVELPVSQPFLSNGFFYQFVETQITILGKTFNVYTSPAATFATSIIIQVS